MNHNCIFSHWIGKSNFLFLITILFHSLCFTSAAFGEPTEIFLPFPETWKESNQNSVVDPTSPNPTGSKTKDNESKTTSNPTGTTTVSNTTLSKEIPNQTEQVVVNGNLPKTEFAPSASKADSKKKKKKEVIDPSKASYQKGKAYLSRDQKKTAEQEFADSYNKEGESAKFSRSENTNLFGLDGKDKESSSLVEKQEDPDFKIKTQFELARSLDRIGNPESEEKAYKEYLKLVTEFPKHTELTPRAHYAMATLLIRKKEYRSAAHQLVGVIKNFKESEEFLPAHYYLGKIYESSWEERDLERALKYYQLYLNGVEGKNPKPGYDFRKETKERLRVLGSAI
ncbi:tol-pal system YbgF family protein [Leptospira sp. WS39.C2]